MLFVEQMPDLVAYSQLPINKTKGYEVGGPFNPHVQLAYDLGAEVLVLCTTFYAITPLNYIAEKKLDFKGVMLVGSFILCIFT